MGYAIVVIHQRRKEIIDASQIINNKYYSSISGWVYTLGGGAISCGSKKQTCLVDSSMVAEFVALGSACKEAEWLKYSLYQMPLQPKVLSPISIRCDSVAILAKAYDGVYNDKSRHISLQHNYVRQLVIDGVITVEFIEHFKTWFIC